MATLNVFDKFGELLEVHQIGTSLEGWLAENVPAYRKMAVPPYSASLNGKAWPYIKHGDVLSERDVIDLTVEPKGPGAFIVVAIIAAAYAYNIATNIPKNYQKTAEDGNSIYSPNARANGIIPNGIVREIAGRLPIIYPDLICAPRRKYINHEEFIYLAMAVTRGYMFLREENFYISETPIVNYANDFTLTIHEPGDSVSTDEAFENWYQSLEVSNLKLITTSTPKEGVWTADYSGATITSYLDGVAEEFPFTVDEDFEITGGSNPGYYRVVSIAGGSNETATVIGLERSGGDTGRLEASIQTTINPDREARYGRGRIGLTSNRNSSPTIRTNIFNSTGSPSLSSATGEAVTWTGLNGGVNWEGPFQPAPAGETCRYVEVDVNFPGGLVFLNGSGEPTNATVDLEIQWRAKGQTAWTTVSSTSYTAATFNERGYTVEIDFGSQIEPEMRIRRVTKDSDDINLQNDVFINRIKCLLETPSSYDDITTCGLVLRGTNALAATSENRINIRNATRKLPTLQQIQDACNGTPFDLSASATQTTDDYLISTAEFLSSTVVVEDIVPALSGNEFSVDFDSTGLEMIVYDNGILRFYTLSVAYRPDLGYTYNGYATDGFAAATTKNAQFWGSTSDVLSLRKLADPATDHYLTHIDFSTPLDPTTASSVANYQFTGIADVRSFYARADQARYWVLQGDDQTIREYDVTPGDITTSSFNTSLDISAQLGDNSADNSLDASSIWLDDYVSGLPTKMWVMTAGGTVHYWTLSGASISTASYVGSYSFTGLGYLTIRMAAEYAIFYSTSGDSAVVVYSLDTVSDSAATRSIPRFVANAIYQDVGNDTLGLIDWDAMATLDTLLTSRGDYLDAEFVDETTLWEAIKVMLAPAYSEPTIKEGKLLPIRIASNNDYEHIYTPDVMLGDGLTKKSSFYIGAEPDGVDVEYLSEDTGQIEVVECRLTGDLGIRPKRINAIGITNRTRAWRYGMRERRRDRYKPAQFTFQTELDALNSNYGSYVALASDLLTGQYGEVVAVSGTTVTLDFDPVFGAGTYYAVFRNPEGEYSGLYLIVDGPSTNQITLQSPSSLDFTPITDGSGDPSYMVMGTAAELFQRAIIRAINPQDDTVDVVCEEYVEDLFDSDDASPP